MACGRNSREQVSSCSCVCLYCIPLHSMGMARPTASTALYTCTKIKKDRPVVYRVQPIPRQLERPRKQPVTVCALPATSPQTVVLAAMLMPTLVIPATRWILRQDWALERVALARALPTLAQLGPSAGATTVSEPESPQSMLLRLCYSPCPLFPTPPLEIDEPCHESISLMSCIINLKT